MTMIDNRQTVERLHDIEHYLYRLVKKHEESSEELHKDVALIISTVQELRFSLEEDLGI
jgi:hypothetical protein